MEAKKSLAATREQETRELIEKDYLLNHKTKNLAFNLLEASDDILEEIDTFGDEELSFAMRNTLHTIAMKPSLV